ncbi:MAG: M48 family metallopeptidase [Candidatus Aminicenantes bacterium]|nr:M48 family metallopeptidase [Candidatus Aminicenantes bacterium]
MINYKGNKKPTDTEVLEFQGVLFNVSRRKVKYPRIEFKSTGPVLIIPKKIDPVSVLQENKKSILKKCSMIEAQVEAARELRVVKRSETEFNDMITLYIEKYSQVLKVRQKGIKFRKMKRRWGSCRNTGVITLNKYLRFVPETLLAYIVFHELVHLKIRGHNRKFKAVIAGQFPDYRVLDKELSLYGFRLLP